MPELLLLSEAEVERALTMAEAIPAVEEAFRSVAAGTAQMPPKLYLDFPQVDGDLRIMPAALGVELAGVKIVNSHPHNPGRGLPAVMATYVLVDQATGAPLAFMGAAHLTAVRTAAASAVATRHLAREEASSLGLVGAGTQAAYHLKAMAEVRAITRVLVWAPAFDLERRDAFVSRARDENPGLAVEAVEEAAGAAAADIVCTTTPSRTPILSDASILPGTHINAVGADAPGKQELEVALLRWGRVVVDDRVQAAHGGEVNVGLASGDLTEGDIDASLDEVISGAAKGRRSAEEVTIFDSTGLAVEDMAVATIVYRRALEEGLGSRFSL